MAWVKHNTISAQLGGSGQRHSSGHGAVPLPYDLNLALKKLESIPLEKLETQLEEVKKQASLHNLSWERAGVLAGHRLKSRIQSRQKITDLIKTLATSNDFYSGVYQTLAPAKKMALESAEIKTSQRRSSSSPSDTGSYSTEDPKRKDPITRYSVLGKEKPVDQDSQISYAEGVSQKRTSGGKIGRAHV